MKLSRLNEHLLCRPVFIQAAVHTSLIFTRMRLQEVTYDRKTKRFTAKVTELQLRTVLWYREADHENGIRLWVEHFRDPFTDEIVSSERSPYHELRGLDFDTIDVEEVTA